ncbi:hypothetical protein T484DRAFT_1931573, partial [Baffinella frigidus]
LRASLRAIQTIGTDADALGREGYIPTSQIKKLLQDGLGWEASVAEWERLRQTFEPRGDGLTHAPSLCNTLAEPLEGMFLSRDGREKDVPSTDEEKRVEVLAREAHTIRTLLAAEATMKAKAPVTGGFHEESKGKGAGNLPRRQQALGQRDTRFEAICDSTNAFATIQQHIPAPLRTLSLVLDNSFSDPEDESGAGDGRGGRPEWQRAPSAKSGEAGGGQDLSPVKDRTDREKARLLKGLTAEKPFPSTSYADFASSRPTSLAESM